MSKKAGCGGSFDGLCCRMVIEAKRVFDGCRFTDENITLTLTSADPIPQQAEFVSARVISSELTNYSVIDGSNGCCRVRGDIVTRFAVTYSSGGSCFTVAAEYTESTEALLRLPNAAIVPYNIEVQAVMSVVSGTVIGQNVVSVSGCLLRIIKVTAQVDILIPTYGYCNYPPCTGCPCNEFGNSDVFPSFADEDIYR